MLSRSFGSISSLERRFLELGALAPVCIHDDGFVVALGGSCVYFIIFAYTRVIFRLKSDPFELQFI